jgi:protein-disulfide isomerase
VSSLNDVIFNNPNDWVGGNPNGDLTLVEFMDYRCGYCRRAFDEVNALLAADGNIRFVIKEYPILGDQSLLAAQFAVAVQQLHGNDVYKDIHDTLMTLDADVTPEILGRLAESFGLEPAPIMAALETEAVMSILTANQDLGRAMQITGTPTFVIGDRMVRGYVPADQMAALVAEVRAAPAP